MPALLCNMGWPLLCLGLLEAVQTALAVVGTGPSTGKVQAVITPAATAFSVCGCDEKLAYRILTKARAIRDVNTTELVMCANASAPPKQLHTSKEEVRFSTRTAVSPLILVMQLATSNLWNSFCGFTSATNGAWARRHGHSYLLTAGEYLDRADLWRGGNVRAVLEVMRVVQPSQAAWLFHLDCDAALVDASDDDALRRVLAEYAKPRTEVLLSRDETGFAGGSRLTNLGTGFWRRSPWTKRFLAEVWRVLLSDPRLVEQEVLERFLKHDTLGCSSRVVILPAGLVNSESANPIAAPSWRQPVVHLAGMPNEVRTAVFRAVWENTCVMAQTESWERPSLLAKTSGWELRDLLLEELRVYALALPDEPPNGAWVEASSTARVTRRLGLSLLHGGNRRDEASEVFRLALLRTHLLERRSEVSMPEVAVPLANMLDSFVSPLMELGSIDEARQILSRPRFASAGKRHQVDQLLHDENVVAVLQADGRLPEAERLSRQVVTGFEAAFPNMAFDTRPASAKVRLSQILHLRGLHEEAEPLLRTALGNFEVSLGLHHPQVLGCVRNLAVLLKQLPAARHAEVLPEVEALLLRAANGFTAALGRQHPDSERAARNLVNFRRWRQARDETPRVDRSNIGHDIAARPSTASVAGILDPRLEVAFRRNKHQRNRHEL
eukprot:TRINITY_DN49085_c0_g1_i1.p1 TRINITY_DN49085_c0_g1~~TRINITY_DN49085_c0_g1_i1.p1  ORF type:complete len:667 (+),score=116.07 TRINITY_DN49085_c0_g1_i1:229-2229(+)